MASVIKSEIRAVQPLVWFDQLEALLARELAPNQRKLRTAFRLSAIGTIGVGLVAICHVNNQLGAYIVWLLVGAGPMMSARKASAFLIAETLALVVSVVMARTFAETPWLLLPFMFAVISFSTYLGLTHKLGAALLLFQVVCLDSFYVVVYAPQAIGWGAAGAFGGSAIAFGVLVLFDNWLWPDPSEAILMESLGASVARSRTRLLEAAKFYLDGEGARPQIPPPTSDLPAHVALLDQAVAEGVTAHRQAILLAAITRMARISLEVDRLVLTVRENVPREIRAMLKPELRAAFQAIAAALDEIARELPTHIAVGVDKPPPASRIRARAAMEQLTARVAKVRPMYLALASAEEIENFASVADSLEVLTGHLDRLLDEPPEPPAASRATNAAPRVSEQTDPALFRHSLKVGLCVMIGYVIGVLTHRAELTTILTTILITALPTYGAAMRKVNLRIVGAIIGGA
ncbi:MAG: hypothetical protein JWM69_11, partial [Candidatus Binatus sp.]|nr:hypothetical protein [Candidatus Binatus sp.]